MMYSINFRFIRILHSKVCNSAIALSIKSDSLFLVVKENNKIVRLQMWDIAGQERFGNMTRVYYKEAVAAMLVVDLTRPTTFEGAIKWKEGNIISSR